LAVRYKRVERLEGTSFFRYKDAGAQQRMTRNHAIEVGGSGRERKRGKGKQNKKDTSWQKRKRKDSRKRKKREGRGMKIGIREVSCYLTPEFLDPTEKGWVGKKDWGNQGPQIRLNPSRELRGNRGTLLRLKVVNIRGTVLDRVRTADGKGKDAFWGKKGKVRVCVGNHPGAWGASKLRVERGA